MHEQGNGKQDETPVPLKIIRLLCCVPHFSDVVVVAVFIISGYLEGHLEIVDEFLSLGCVRGLMKTAPCVNELLISLLVLCREYSWRVGCHV